MLKLLLIFKYLIVFPKLVHIYKLRKYFKTFNTKNVVFLILKIFTKFEDLKVHNFTFVLYNSKNFINISLTTEAIQYFCSNVTTICTFQFLIRLVGMY